MSVLIPEDPSAFTPEWFVAACPQLPPMAGLSLDASLPQGLTSRVVRIVPEYAREPGPRSLVVKFTSDNPGIRDRPHNRLGAVRETRFFQDLAASVPVDTPACYFAASDVDEGSFVIVLEDLSGDGWRSAEQGCSRTEAAAAVRSLAAFHGHWWGGVDFDWLPDPAPLDPDVARTRHQQWWPEFRAVAGELLPEEIQAFGDRLGERFADLMAHLQFSPPRTLRHGDYSLANLHFRSDGRAVIIDWQSLTQGRGAWDLAYFLGQSLTIEQRRAWEEELLDLYCHTLSLAGVPDYGPDLCRADYRVAIAQRFGTLISSIVVLPFTPAQKAEILRVQVPRNVAAVMDLGGLALLD